MKKIAKKVKRIKAGRELIAGLRAKGGTRKPMGGDLDAGHLWDQKKAVFLVDLSKRAGKNCGGFWNET